MKKIQKDLRGSFNVFLNSARQLEVPLRLPRVPFYIQWLCKKIFRNEKRDFGHRWAHCISFCLMSMEIMQDLFIQWVKSFKARSLIYHCIYESFIYLYMKQCSKLMVHPAPSVHLTATRSMIFRTCAPSVDVFLGCYHCYNEKDVQKYSWTHSVKPIFYCNVNPFALGSGIG